MSLSCVACQLSFGSLDGLKDHYKTELHVYNLRRKTAGLAPVAEAAFQRRKAALLIKQQQLREARTGGVEGAVLWKCEPCGKAFKSKKAYDQHTLSNKHKEIARRGAAEGPKAASIGAGAGAGPAAAAPPATEAVSRPKVVTEETAIANPAPPKPRAVPVTCCLFDGSHHVDLEANLAYMKERFNFTLPDEEYLVDRAGLLKYLGQKVGLGQMCIYCNRAFPTLQAVRQHMVDVAHLKMLYEEENQYEYEAFYDFSASYEGKEHVKPAEVDDLTGELRLGDGRLLGHRQYRRYYAQNIQPESTSLAVERGRSEAFERMMRQAAGGAGGAAGAGHLVAAGAGGRSTALVAVSGHAMARAQRAAARPAEARRQAAETKNELKVAQHKGNLAKSWGAAQFYVWG